MQKSATLVGTGLMLLLARYYLLRQNGPAMPAMPATNITPVRSVTPTTNVTNVKTSAAPKESINRGNP